MGVDFAKLAQDLSIAHESGLLIKPPSHRHPGFSSESNGVDRGACSRGGHDGQ
jgi:hypothetical protein